MTRIELTDFFHSNFELSDTHTSIQDSVIDDILDNHDLTDITTCDLIELLDNELFTQNYSYRNKI